MLLGLFALCAVASAVRVQDQGSVIQKVIEMLEANKMKVAKDLASEEAEMEAFAEYCDDETTKKQYAIKDGERKIADIGASIEDAESQIRAFDSDIASLGNDAAAKEKDIYAAESTRKTEKEDFKAQEQTMEDSLTQLEKAIAAVKKDDAAGGEATAAAPESFLQQSSSPRAKELARKLKVTLGPVINAVWVGATDAKAIKAFLQSQEAAGEGESEGDLSLASARQEPTPEPAGGVLQTLEDMKTKAEEALSKARQEEMNADFNYQMMMQSMKNAMDIITKKLGSAKEGKSSMEQGVGKAKQELVAARKSKLADQAYLKSLTHECQSTAQEWSDRQKEAKGEMAALDKAKEILSSRVKALVQHDDDFLSGDEAGSPQSPVRDRLVRHLKDLGHKLHSYALAELAGAAVADPFAKIKGIIEDMVGKLTAEANEQATHKAFCDDEKKKGETEKSDKSMRVDELRNRIDTATAKTAALRDLIKELQAEITEIDTSGAEATKLREAQHASYLVASKDFRDGAQAVEDAIKVLKDYYSSVSLVQASGPSFGGSKGDAASTIIGILENSQEEFTQMYMEAETDEKEAADVYKKLTQENTVSRASKVAEIKGSESEIKSLEVAIQNNGADFKLASQELDAVLDYLEKLRPQCEAKVMTYAEKAAKRQAEIEGLKEALSILDAPALVQTKKHA